MRRPRASRNSPWIKNEAIGHVTGDEMRTAVRHGALPLGRVAGDVPTGVHQGDGHPCFGSSAGSLPRFHVSNASMAPPANRCPRRSAGSYSSACRSARATPSSETRVTESQPTGHLYCERVEILSLFRHISAIRRRNRRGLSICRTFERFSTCDGERSMTSTYGLDMSKSRTDFDIYRRSVDRLDACPGMGRKTRRLRTHAVRSVACL